MQDLILNILQMEKKRIGKFCALYPTKPSELSSIVCLLIGRENEKKKKNMIVPGREIIPFEKEKKGFESYIALCIRVHISCNYCKIEKSTYCKEFFSLSLTLETIHYYRKCIMAT